MLVHRQLTSAVVSLIGPNVQLHHTKLHVKPPYKGSPFPLHQDYEYFPHANDTMLAAVVYLEDYSVENGTIVIERQQRDDALNSIENVISEFIPKGKILTWR